MYVETTGLGFKKSPCHPGKGFFSISQLLVRKLKSRFYIPIILFRKVLSVLLNRHAIFEVYSSF